MTAKTSTGFAQRLGFGMVPRRCENDGDVAAADGQSAVACGESRARGEDPGEFVVETAETAPPEAMRARLSYGVTTVASYRRLQTLRA